MESILFLFLAQTVLVSLIYEDFLLPHKNFAGIHLVKF